MLALIAYLLASLLAVVFGVLTVIALTLVRMHWRMLKARAAEQDPMQSAWGEVGVPGQAITFHNESK